jgi:hypothetical protein
VPELRLMASRCWSGGGKRAIPQSRQKKRFTLTDVERFRSGVAVHTYGPAA